MQRPLHALEKKILEVLSTLDQVTFDVVKAKSGLLPDQVRRATEWLRTKRMVEVTLKERRQLSLGEQGSKAAKIGLPERRLHSLISGVGGKADIQWAKRLFGATEEEFSAALGHARELGWIKIVEVSGEPILTTSSNAEASLEERLVKRLREGEAEFEELPQDLWTSLTSLLRRPGYITEKSIKTMTLQITDDGRSALKAAWEVSTLDALSPKALASGAWRTRPVRAIDVEAPAARIYAGKKHPVQRFIDEVREIFLALGFQEIEGPLVQPCFWNFDALFTPQDHPAREMQDTFYVTKAKARRLDSSVAVRRVASAHQNGGGTGSKGWGYKWSIEEAKRLVLRTHTTAVTIKYLSDNKPDEARVFSVGRVFRNEKVSFKNLVEFYQIEGIAVGADVSMRDMMGLLSEFYSRLGLRKVKFWPSYRSEERRVGKECRL